MKCKKCNCDMKFKYFKENNRGWYEEYYECEKCGTQAVVSIEYYKPTQTVWYFKEGCEK